MNILLKTAILGLFLGYSSIIGAADRIRIYAPEKGYSEYKGYMAKQYDGSYRMYDKYGKYKGKLTTDGLYLPDGTFQRIDKYDSEIIFK